MPTSDEEKLKRRVLKLKIRSKYASRDVAAVLLPKLRRSKSARVAFRPIVNSQRPIWRGMNQEEYVFSIKQLSVHELSRILYKATIPEFKRLARKIFREKFDPNRIRTSRVR